MKKEEGAIPLSRRDALLRLAGFGFVLSGCYAVSQDAPEAPFGEYLAGGQIIADRDELHDILQDKIAQKANIEPDPTIIKSVAYHGLLFGGIDPYHARLRADKIAIAQGSNSSESCVGGAMCVDDKYGTSGADWIIIDGSRFLDNTDWSRYINQINHEVGHTLKGRRKYYPIPKIERYGRFAEYRIFSKNGFVQSNYPQPSVELLQTPYRFPNETVYPVPVLSEFFATSYSIPATQALGIDPISQKENFYTFVQDGIYDMYKEGAPAEDDIDWKGVWGDVCAIDSVKYYQQQYMSHEFAQRMGARVLALRRQGDRRTFSPDYVAAIGLIAFRDWADKRLSDRAIVRQLLTGEFDEEYIDGTASHLAQRQVSLATTDTG